MIYIGNQSRSNIDVVNRYKIKEMQEKLDLCRAESGKYLTKCIISEKKAMQYTGNFSELEDKLYSYKDENEEYQRKLTQYEESFIKYIPKIQELEESLNSF